jgi:aminoacrylate hydrolase
MPDFDNNRASIHYEAEGTGRPLLLLAGITSDGASWAPLSKLLSDDHRMIVINNRGSGRTSCEGAFTIADMIGDCIALLDHLGIASADIVGHSMGGMIGLRLAEAHPARVRRLVTVTAAQRATGKQELLFDELVRLYAELPPQRWYGIFFQWLLSDAAFDNPANIAAATEVSAAYAYRQSHADFVRQLAALKAMPAVDPSRIACPVLAIAAEHDILIPPAAVRAAHRDIPIHRFEVIANAAHGVPVEASDALARLIHEFLS